MKVKVVQSFIDKETKQVRNIGDEFECKDARFEAIETAGHYVKKIVDHAKPKSNK